MLIIVHLVWCTTRPGHANPHPCSFPDVCTIFYSRCAGWQRSRREFRRLSHGSRVYFYTCSGDVANPASVTAGSGKAPKLSWSLDHTQTTLFHRLRYTVPRCHIFVYEPCNFPPIACRVAGDLISVLLPRIYWARSPQWVIKEIADDRQ